jgi:hypothetical protein
MLFPEKNLLLLLLLLSSSPFFQMIRSISSSGSLPFRVTTTSMTSSLVSRWHYHSQTSDTENFDVCVIGCGPAGFAATMRAFDLKKRVCVIEKGKVGGTGLHNGALSSKALWEVSRQYKDTQKFVNSFSAEPNDDRNRCVMVLLWRGCFLFFFFSFLTGCQ